MRFSENHETIRKWWFCDFSENAKTNLYFSERPAAAANSFQRWGDAFRSVATDSKYALKQSNVLIRLIRSSTTTLQQLRPIWEYKIPMLLLHNGSWSGRPQWQYPCLTSDELIEPAAMSSVDEKDPLDYVEVKPEATGKAKAKRALRRDASRTKCWHARGCKKALRARALTDSKQNEGWQSSSADIDVAWHCLVDVWLLFTVPETVEDSKKVIPHLPGEGC